MFHPSLRVKLTLVHLLLIAALSLAVGIFTLASMQRFFKQRLAQNMETELQQVHYLLQHTALGSIAEPMHYQELSRYANTSRFRLTLIDSSGVVRFDSKISVDSLALVDNHRNRLEVRMALNEGFGTDQRLSSTLNEPFYYGALRIKHNYLPQTKGEMVRFIRIALPLAEIQRQFQDLRRQIVIAGLAAWLLIGCFSFWLAGRLSYPIQKLAAVAEKVRRGDLEVNFQHRSRDELGELADHLNQMLNKLRRDMVQLRKLEQVRSQFLGNVSHELRTPVFTLLGYLETLLHSHFENAEQQQEFIGKAYQQSSRLNDLLSDLIDISRIESGEMKMAIRSFDLHAFLANQCDELQKKAEQQHIALSFANVEAKNQVWVKGDPEHLSQVITNLAENAIKYNVENGTVEIGYREAGEGVEVYVQDTGRGIPENHLPRIFERFYRVDKERSRAVGGTGLGLAIVKHIIEAHGGQVQVQSQVGKGSRFYFHLSRAK